MESSGWEAGSVALAALALGEASPVRLDTHRADALVRCLRRWPALPPAEALHKEGFRSEALVLDGAGVDGSGSQAWEHWAGELREGRVLTRACAGYPDVWRMGARPSTGTPPSGRVAGQGPVALRLAGGRFPSSGRWVAVVGSRDVSSEALRWAREAGAALAGGGLGVVSGGAPGVDAAALTGAALTWAPLEGAVSGGKALALLPAGLEAGFYGGPGVRASDLPLRAPFSAKAAMVRNAWVVALAEAIVVADLRWGQGGTFQTVQMAFRARRPIVCRLDPAHPGLCRLAAAGAHAVAWPPNEADVAEAQRAAALRLGRLQPALSGL